MPSPVFSYALSLSRLLVSQLESVSALCSGADLTIPPEPSAEVVEDPSTGTLVCDSTALSSWGYAGWTMASALSKEIQSLRDWKESSMEGWSALGANPEIPSTVDLESHAVWLLEKAGGVVSDPSLPTRERVRVLLVRMLLADGLVEVQP